MAQRAKNNVQIAVDVLREMIFSGELPAGSDHLEAALAVRLGMSRTPVREAALVLQAQGLVEVRARKGIRVQPISIVDMEEIYDVLTALESMAAAQAASMGYDEDALRPVSQTIADMDKALEHGDREAWAAADDRFHTELVLLGGNSRVIGIVALMADQVRRVRAVTLHLRPLPLRSNADHRDLLDAIRGQDADAAARIHKAHRTAAKEVLIAILRQNELQSL